MVSALDPNQYDLPKLREMLGQQKTVQEVDQSKQAAARQQGNSVLGWIDRQNLPQHADRISHVEQNVEEVINDRLGDPTSRALHPRHAR